MDDVNNIVASKSVIEFATIASEYCSLVESIFETEKKEFVNSLLALLPMLYLKVQFLPELEFISEDLIDKSVSEEEWETINNDVAKMFSDDNKYIEIYDPVEETAVSKETYISENIADIYQDVKDFVNMYHQGSIEAMNDAIVECKNNFKDYWGQHLVNSLRILHNIKNRI